MNYAVVLAGGKGKRFGNELIPKQFVELAGVPMIVYSLLTAQRNENIDEICVVAARKEKEKVVKWAGQYGITKLKYFAEPGQKRQESVFSGLKQLSAGPRDTVLIMTSVCPLVSQRTIDRQYEMIKAYDASITVIKATDAVTFSSDGKCVNRTLQKKKLYMQQGPQIFRYGVLMEGHYVYMGDENYSQMDVTEDSELVLNMGVECAMVLGDRFCIKVTYPEDLSIVELLLPLFRRQEEIYAAERNYTAGHQKNT